MKAKYLLIFLFLLHCTFIFADNGTLIVTYQAGTQGERLDRVRFLLRDSQLQEKMYPKGHAYIDDIAGHTRVVIIQDIPPGDYMVEFIIPNRDGLFEETICRPVAISPEKVVKIDQIIKLK